MSKHSLFAYSYRYSARTNAVRNIPALYSSSAPFLMLHLDLFPKNNCKGDKSRAQVIVLLVWLGTVTCFPSSHSFWWSCLTSCFCVTLQYTQPDLVSVGFNAPCVLLCLLQSTWALNQITEHVVLTSWVLLMLLLRVCWGETADMWVGWMSHIADNPAAKTWKVCDVTQHHTYGGRTYFSLSGRVSFFH